MGSARTGCVCFGQWNDGTGVDVEAETNWDLYRSISIWKNFGKAVGHSRTIGSFHSQKLVMETNHPWLEEVRPCVREKLQQFFSHTLAIATQNRYPSDEAIITALEELVAASDPTAIFLRSSYLEKKSTFYGREDELKQMERLQKERKRIFLTGMGGIGKSELARTYAVEHRREYDTIILARYESTLEDVIRRVSIEHLVHFGGEGLPPEQYFALAKRKLKECCVEEKVLLILDNLDVDSDTGMQEFLEMGWDVIVTTRYHWKNTKTIVSL